jgi:hypothetical protein
MYCTPKQDHISTNSQKVKYRIYQNQQLKVKYLWEDKTVNYRCLLKILYVIVFRMYSTYTYTCTVGDENKLEQEPNYNTFQ